AEQASSNSLPSGENWALPTTCRVSGSDFSTVAQSHNTGRWLAATRNATRAPASVPSACARKGNTKCFGSNRCIDALRLWGSDTSTPAGGGITWGLAATSAMLTTPPTIRPATTARMFRNTFIRVIPPCDDAARQTEAARPDGSRSVLDGCHDG